MTPKLSDEQKQALTKQPGQPLQVEDPDTHVPYVIIPLDVFQQMLQTMACYDGEVTPQEMMAVAQQALADLEGWGAQGMEVYDSY